MPNGVTRNPLQNKSAKKHAVTEENNYNRQTIENISLTIENKNS